MTMEFPKIAVMSYMDIGLQHIVGSNMGFTAFSGGSVYGDKFTDQVIVSNHHGAELTLVFKVLRISAQHGMTIDFIIPADLN